MTDGSSPDLTEAKPLSPEEQRDADRFAEELSRDFKLNDPALSDKLGKLSYAVEAGVLPKDQYLKIVGKIPADSNTEVEKLKK